MVAYRSLGYGIPWVSVWSTMRGMSMPVIRTVDEMAYWGRK